MCAALENPYRAPQQGGQAPPGSAAANAHHGLLDPPIRTDHQLQSSDVLPATLLYFGGGRALLCVAVIYCIELAVFASWPIQTLSFRLAAILSLSAMLFWRVVIFWRCRRRLYRQVNSPPGTTCYFRSDGFYVDDVRGRSAIRWSQLVLAKPTDSIVLLSFRSARMSLVLTRRMFDSKQQWHRLLRFLTHEVREARQKHMRQGATTAARPAAASLMEWPIDLVAAERNGADNVGVARGTLLPPILLATATNDSAVHYRWWSVYFDALLFFALGVALATTLAIDVRASQSLTVPHYLGALVILSLMVVMFKTASGSAPVRRDGTFPGETVSIQIDSTKSITRTSELYVETRWDNFAALALTPDAIHLSSHHRRQRHLTLPRTCFPSEQDWQRAVTFFQTRFPIAPKEP